MNTRPHWFVRGDLDGFFALFIDNLLQIMVIAYLLPAVCGIPDAFVTHTILPGAALSILFGNVFYSWQAYRLSLKTGRNDIAALPYGINTVSLFAYIFFIMAPIWEQTHDYHLVWQAGLTACFIGGIFEIFGAFVGDYLRRHTPRASLLSALSGIAVTFIAMGFIFRLFACPAIALIPMLVILAGYASRVKMPAHLPAGMIAVLLGAALAWGLKWLGYNYWTPPPYNFHAGFHPPRFLPADAIVLLTTATGWKYLSVIFPMALFNIIGSLQNLESAEAAGDRFETRSSLLANGIGSLVASLCGSPFPTTIYIGHPGWKAMGARIGYSTLNGLVISLLCLFGAISIVLHYIPIEATLGILLWIGVIITAQAFQEVPREHAPAVALGLIPCLASWAFVLINTTLSVAGSSLYDATPKFGEQIFIQGVFALNQGFMLSSMIFSAMLVFLIERRFLVAAGLSAAAAVLSAVGLMHAYKLTPAGLENLIGLQSAGGGWGLAAPEFTLAYLGAAVILVLVHFYAKGTGQE